ncbi:uncharacterized protein LOC135335266 isoform X3 [Halichondria panicea]|uniref:uncharacterized protein LOC135335266 isoform X3 n=1 Tax=Halichondria panicea TaxID=6063 RepID=UPI00312B753C
MSGCLQEKAEKTTPSISSPTFPYLDTKRLSEPEKRMLFDKLTTDYESIVSAFCKLCMALSKSPALKDEIENIKLFLSASAIFSKEEKMKLLSSKTMTEVLMILQLRVSFFNHQTIKLVVNEFGSSDDKHKMQKYLQEFKSYCEHDVFEVPHSVFHPGHTEDREHSKYFALKYSDSEEDPIKLQKITKICSRIAKTLHINSWALSLVSIEKGCIVVTFAIPIAIATNVLPISEGQLTELSRYGLGAIDDRALEEFSNTTDDTILKLDRENSTKHELYKAEVDNEEEATDVTWESGYGTGEAVLQEWIGEGHQSTLSTDSDLVSIKDWHLYTPLLTLSEKDSGPYESLYIVKSNQLVSSDAFQQQMGMRYAFRTQTFHWLHENLESSESCYVSKTTLYDHYRRHCTALSMEPVTIAVFGKLIHSLFTRMTTKRLGTR